MGYSHFCTPVVYIVCKGGLFGLPQAETVLLFDEVAYDDITRLEIKAVGNILIPFIWCTRPVTSIRTELYKFAILIASHGRQEEIIAAVVRSLLLDVLVIRWSYKGLIVNIVCSTWCFFF